MRIMREIVQPTEPSEFGGNQNDELELTARNPINMQSIESKVQMFHLDKATPQSDKMTCNLRSTYGSPKINQDAVRQILG